MEVKNFKEIAKSMGYVVWLMLFIKFHEPDFLHSEASWVLIPTEIFKDVAIMLSFPIGFFALKNNYSTLFWFSIGIAFIFFQALKVKQIYCFALLPYAFVFLQERELRKTLLGIHLLLCFCVAFYVDILYGDNILMFDYLSNETLKIRNFIDLFGFVLFTWTVVIRFKDYIKSK